MIRPYMITLVCVASTVNLAGCDDMKVVDAEYFVAHDVTGEKFILSWTCEQTGASATAGFLETGEPIQLTKTVVENDDSKDVFVFDPPPNRVFASIKLIDVVGAVAFEQSPVDDEAWEVEGATYTLQLSAQDLNLDNSGKCCCERILNDPDPLPRDAKECENDGGTCVVLAPDGCID